MKTATLNLSIALAVWAALLAGSAVLLSATTFEPAFVEDGPIEAASVALWIGLALALLAWRHRLSRLTRLTGVVLALAAAAREASWHQAFTTDGMTKLRYYADTSVPFVERVLAAALVLILLFIAAFALVHAVRRLRDGGWRRPSGQAVVVGIGLLLFTKALDRAPAVFAESLGLDFSQRALRLMQALEEGLEMALPLVFLSAGYHAASRMLPAAARVASSSGGRVPPARLPSSPGADVPSRPRTPG